MSRGFKEIFALIDGGGGVGLYTDLLINYFHKGYGYGLSLQEMLKVKLCLYRANYL